jgi:hypothetical protein
VEDRIMAKDTKIQCTRKNVLSYKLYVPEYKDLYSGELSILSISGDRLFTSISKSMFPSSKLFVLRFSK